VVKTKRKSKYTKSQWRQIRKLLEQQQAEQRLEYYGVSYGGSKKGYGKSGEGVRFRANQVSRINRVKRHKGLEKLTGKEWEYAERAWLKYGITRYKTQETELRIHGSKSTRY